MESAAHLKPGTEIAAYRVLEKLREGGMAVLYQVASTTGGEAGLLKVPKLDFGSHPACYAGFEVEQMILGRLAGPHVPRLLASGESDFGPYLVMEHIRGTSFADYAAGAPPITGPALEKLLARGHGEALPDASLESVLCGAFGVPCAGELPLASIAAAFDACEKNVWRFGFQEDDKERQLLCLHRHTEE